MRETFIVGDIHDRIHYVQSILDTYNPERIIFLGDWFDSFNNKWSDNAEAVQNAGETAELCARLIDTRPNDIFLLGNHCYPYFAPHPDKNFTWGFTHNKYAAIQKWMKQQHWDRIRLSYLQEWAGRKLLFSHAGFRKELFPFQQFCQKHLIRASELAIKNIKKSEQSAWLDNGIGPLWARDLPIFSGISQIFGHSTVKEIKVDHFKGDFNACLDCIENYVGVFNDDGLYQLNWRTGNRKLLVSSNGQIITNRTQYLFGSGDPLLDILTL